MPEPGDPHDKLFRALLDDPDRARALLREHLPVEIVAEFDWQTSSFDKLKMRSSC